MALLTKSRLEEEEVCEGENRVLRTFAREAAAESPNNAISTAFSLALKQEASSHQNQAASEELYAYKWPTLRDEALSM